MDNYTFRFLTKKDTDEINTLFKASFEVAVKDRFVNWKYFKNPEGNALLAGAFHKNKLVGFGAMIPEKLNVFDKEEIIFKCTDLMTHPLHQRKGLSKSINKLLVEETLKTAPAFLYTLCSKVSTKSFVRNNWLFLNQVTNFFKPLVIVKMHNLLRNDDFSNIEVYDSIQHHLDDYSFKTDSSNISQHKTPNYLKWRTANPNFSYTLICSYDNNKRVDGYLIFSISNNNLLNIIDLESSSNSSKIERKLIRYVESIVVKKKYKGVLILTVKNSPLYKFSKKNNYLINPFKRGPLKTILDVNIYLNTIDLSKLNIPYAWDINGLAYDDI